MYLGSIASGSSGNSIYVGSKDDHFLVDAGISRKRIVEGLSSLHVDPAKLKGIFITHEHNDHIKGLGVFLRKYPVPVFATAGTLDAIFSSGCLGKTDPGLFYSLEADRPVKIGNVRVEASRVYHDAADPVCYTFADEEDKVGIATDFGTFDDYLVEKFTGLSTLLVESNHDFNMLMAGPYPYPLKRRITGNLGHMSNERTGQFLSKVIDGRCRRILLGHLSRHNNLAELAFETVKLELALRNIHLEQRGIDLQVADRDAPTFPDQKG